MHTHSHIHLGCERSACVESVGSDAWNSRRSTPGYYMFTCRWCFCSFTTLGEELRVTCFDLVLVVRITHTDAADVSGRVSEAIIIFTWNLSSFVLFSRAGRASILRPHRSRNAYGRVVLYEEMNMSIRWMVIINIILWNDCSRNGFASKKRTRPAGNFTTGHTGEMGEMGSVLCSS